MWHLLAHAVMHGGRYVMDKMDEKREARLSSRIERAAGELGYPAHVLNEECVFLDVPFSGVKYEVMVCRIDNRVLFEAASAIKFLPGRLPLDLWRGLAARNASLSTCQFRRADLKRHSEFKITTTCGLVEFNSRLTAIAIQEIVPKIAELDEFLKDGGYAR